VTAFGVSMVLDEADVIETTVRHLVWHLDGLIIADNGSTDGTREILDRLSRELPLTVLDDPEPGYYQSAKMTRLAGLAAEKGADWVVPFDADELWVPLASGIRLSRLLSWRSDAGDRVLYGDVINHYCALATPEHPDYSDLGLCWPDFMPWKDPRPGLLPKVAIRWEDGAVIEQGNHGVKLGSGVLPKPGTRRFLEVRHFPYRSPEQFERKARNGAAAYAAAPDLPADFGTHWRAYGRILNEGGPEALRAIWDEHFLYRDTTGLIYDPAQVGGR